MFNTRKIQCEFCGKMVSEADGYDAEDGFICDDCLDLGIEDDLLWDSEVDDE